MVVREAWPYRWDWPVLAADVPKPALEEIHFLASEVRPLSPTEAQGILKKTGLEKKGTPIDEMEEQLKRIRDKERKKKK